MTTTELDQVIHDYILDIYHKQYIGKLEITKLNPVGYSIKFGLDRPNKPMTIYAELEDDKFLKFLKQELRNRRFNLIYYGELKLTYPIDCVPINTACGCQKKN